MRMRIGICAVDIRECEYSEILLKLDSFKIYKLTELYRGSWRSKG